MTISTQPSQLCVDSSMLAYKNANLFVTAIASIDVHLSGNVPQCASRKSLWYAPDQKTV